MRFPTLLYATLAVATVTSSGVAQDRDRDREPRPTVRVFRGDDDDRAVLGVNTATSGERDTLGLLIVGITPGGPAEKAGLEEGNRIAAVNGVNLRLSAADAGEQDMRGMTTRRLVRELRKVEPGAEVELRVWSGGQYRNVRVKTVAAEELPGRRRVDRADWEDRPVLGLDVGGSGSRRDTLGVFVSGVAEGGPAERAGIVEGDRIAAINGVDLRVSREDAGDEWVGGAKHSRFSRELRKVKVGDDVQLRVYSGGQFKNVTVKAARARDVYEGRRGRFSIGEGGFGLVLPAIPPVPPVPPVHPFRGELWPAPGPDFHFGPGVRIYGPDIELDMLEHFRPDVHRWHGEVIDDAQRSAREAERAARAAERDARREVERARRRARTEVLSSVERAADAAEMEPALEDLEDVIIGMEPSIIALASDAAAGAGDVFAAVAPAVAGAFIASDDDAGAACGAGGAWAHGEHSRLVADDGVESATGTGESYTFRVAGLCLTKVTSGLAEYLGAGTEAGLLVLEADGRWPEVRAGDVLLAVDGKRVRAGECATVSIDSRRTSRLLLLRKGERLTVVGGR